MTLKTKIRDNLKQDCVYIPKWSVIMFWCMLYAYFVNRWEMSDLIHVIPIMQQMCEISYLPDLRSSITSNWNMTAAPAATVFWRLSWSAAMHCGNLLKLWFFHHVCSFCSTLNGGVCVSAFFALAGAPYWPMH